MSVLHVMPGLDDARWIQHQIGMCLGWMSGISSMTLIIVTAADAERGYGSLMEREEIVHHDKPIAAACDAGGYVFREERKERQKEYKISQRRHIEQCPSERRRLTRDECKSKSLQWVHAAGSGFHFHFVEAESFVEEKMFRNRVLWKIKRQKFGHPTGLRQGPHHRR